MRNIEVKKWKAVGFKGEEVEDNFLNVIKVAVNSIPPNQQLKGLDHFRMFNRLSHCLDKAETSGFLELEEAEFLFIKDAILKHIPASLGMNPNIAQAIEEFLVQPGI